MSCPTSRSPWPPPIWNPRTRQPFGRPTAVRGIRASGASPLQPGVTTAEFRDMFAGNYAEKQTLLSDQVLVDVSVYPDRRLRRHLVDRVVRFEAATLDGVDPAEHLSRGRELAAVGYRPVAWSVSRTAPGGPAGCRPRSGIDRQVTAEAKRSAGPCRQREAAVAAGAAREGGVGLAFLAAQAADPSVRSFIVNWLKPLGADPHVVAAELVRLASSPRPAERGEGWPRPSPALLRAPSPQGRGGAG